MEAAMKLPAGSMRVIAAEDVKRFYEDFYRSVSLHHSDVHITDDGCELDS